MVLSSLINFQSKIWPNNLILTLVTYGSGFTLLLAFQMIRYKEGDYNKLLRFIVIFTFIEICIGYFQMVSTYHFTSFNPFNLSVTAGDNFTGTLINPGFAHIAGIKISLVVMLYLPIWISKKSLSNLFILMFLIIGWVLTSALFSLVLGLAAIGIYYGGVFLGGLIRRGKLSTSTFWMIVSGVLITIALLISQRKNFEYAISSLDIIYNTFKGDNSKGLESQKLLFFKTTLTDLPSEYPTSLIWGVGPGNYSSRSAWIASGMYLKTPPGFLKVTPSRYAEELTIPYFLKIEEMKHSGAGSITHQPFSSLFSVFAETGILGLLLFLIILFRTFRRSNHVDKNFANYWKGMKIIFIYLLFLLLVDNIFEYPQIMGQIFIFASFANTSD